MSSERTANPYGVFLGRISTPTKPWLTLVVFVVTLACGVAQLVHRSLYDAVVRDAVRIDDGQWYRLLTAMFFQDGWAVGLISNLIGLAVLGTIAERVFGRGRWLVLYFVCGWFGQLMSYLWLSPVGAGNSMCIAGLLGGLAAVALRPPAGVPVHPRVRMVAIAIPVLAVVDTVIHDNHGLPALLGLVLGFLLGLPRREMSVAP
ncbi:rhomboid family intramembrane serine protease [Kribbella sp. NPDC058245]|uniref:rhomboid family intramembrane serine protease n=1 Tax=Kribbella sp. NPDC058245 TaxID=3346399 RepID=UPI0036E4DCD3